jgi:hypothetical protein
MNRDDVKYGGNDQHHEQRQMQHMPHREQALVETRFRDLANGIEVDAQEALGAGPHLRASSLTELLSRQMPIDQPHRRAVQQPDA